MTRPPVLLLDVNVCLYAMRADLPQHDVVSRWLERRLEAAEPVGVSELVLSSLLRISTHHRIFAEPSGVRESLTFCDALLAAPASVAVRPGPRHWRIFTELVASQRLRGNEVPDAYLAALALENGATWVSADRGFARFPGLAWRIHSWTTEPRGEGRGRPSRL